LCVETPCANLSNSRGVRESPWITQATIIRRKKPCVTTRIFDSERFSRCFSADAPRNLRSEKFSPFPTRIPSS
ncbi:MAG: hypothetical protein AAB798_01760, partial [Patescibacteria group bacterium]